MLNDVTRPIHATDLRVLCTSFHKATSTNEPFVISWRKFYCFGVAWKVVSCLLNPQSPQPHAITVLIRQPRGQAPPAAARNRAGSSACAKALVLIHFLCGD